jgi:hypothetical protein
MTKNYYVIKDTREKNGYKFSEFERCLGTVQKRLETGDYSIDGLEELICIERKASVEEIAHNLGQEKERFHREIERMAKYKYRFIILEFSIQDLLDFPEKTKIPESLKKSVRVHGKFILKKLMEFQVNNDINVIFAGDKNNGFYFVASLLKRLSEKHLNDDE